jgi:N-hydroxyarylamine O-acetyltransferase
MMDIGAYFDRIRYTGPVAPGVRTLRALHRHHLLTVPFENLDIGRGCEIVLDTERFVKKIVNGRRGGFCYELNGAFASLLTALGFRVKLLSVRVAGKKGVPSREFDHLALYVETGEARSQEACLMPEFVPQGLLVDVGFGDNFLEPLRFADGLEQQDAAGRFRLVHARERWGLERRDETGEWRLQYDFLLKPRQLAEFAGMCRYHQTSRDSHFTRNRICSLATPTGRITLSGMRLIVRSNGGRQEQVLTTQAELHRALRDHFGVVLDHRSDGNGLRGPKRGPKPALESTAC